MPELGAAYFLAPFQEDCWSKAFYFFQNTTLRPNWCFKISEFKQNSTKKAWCLENHCIWLIHLDFSKHHFFFQPNMRWNQVRFQFDIYQNLIGKYFGQSPKECIFSQENVPQFCIIQDHLDLICLPTPQRKYGQIWESCLMSLSDCPEDSEHKRRRMTKKMAKYE